MHQRERLHSSKFVQCAIEVNFSKNTRMLGRLRAWENRVPGSRNSEVWCLWWKLSESRTPSPKELRPKVCQRARWRKSLNRLAHQRRRHKASKQQTHTVSALSGECTSLRSVTDMIGPAKTRGRKDSFTQVTSLRRPSECVVPHGQALGDTLHIVGPRRVEHHRLNNPVGC